MTEKELVKITIEEFARVQRYLLLIQDKNQPVYQAIYDRYIELKVFLMDSGVNLTQLDKIQE